MIKSVKVAENCFTGIISKFEVHDVSALFAKFSILQFVLSHFAILPYIDFNREIPWSNSTYKMLSQILLF